MQPRESKEFVKKLYDILEDNSNNNCIIWSVNGHSFIIIDSKQFAEVVLHKTFRHKNLSSFIRQLNKYDFHKIRSSKSVVLQYGDSVLEFEHMYFQKGKRNQLYKIKRKSSSKEAASLDFDLLPGSESYKLFQSHVVSSFKDISDKFSIVIDNINEIKKKIRDINFNKTYFSSVIIFDEDINMSMQIYKLLRDKRLNLMLMESKSNLFGALKIMKFDFIIIGASPLLLQEIMRFIRRFDCVTPVVYLGYDNLDIDIYSLGVTDFLKKPFTFSEFYNLITKYMNINI